MLIHSSQKSLARRADSAAERVGGRVGRTMDESVINFKNVSRVAASPPLQTSIRQPTPIAPYTPSSDLTTTTEHPRPTVETVSDHAAAAAADDDGILGEFVCGAYTLSRSGPPERAGQPVRTDFSRQSDVRAPFVVVTSPRRAVIVGVSSSSSSCARFRSFPFVFL
ncbi:hypothetical protein QTP88_008439 [Uroleucon formosanum]